jgi:regulator of replication initiation timing
MLKTRIECLKETLEVMAASNEQEAKELNEKGYDQISALHRGFANGYAICAAQLGEILRKEEENNV